MDIKKICSNLAAPMRTGTKFILWAAILLAALIIFAVFALPFLNATNAVYAGYKEHIFALIQSLIPWVGAGYLGNEGRKAVENRNGRALPVIPDQPPDPVPEQSNQS